MCMRVFVCSAVGEEEEEEEEVAAGRASAVATARQDNSTNAYLSHANWRARLKKSTHLIN